MHLPSLLLGSASHRIHSAKGTILTVNSIGTVGPFDLQIGTRPVFCQRLLPVAAPAFLVVTDSELLDNKPCEMCDSHANHFDTIALRRLATEQKENCAGQFASEGATTGCNGCIGADTRIQVPGSQASMFPHSPIGAL